MVSIRPDKTFGDTRGRIIEMPLPGNEPCRAGLLAGPEVISE
jgi:hypothetical protein